MADDRIKIDLEQTFYRVEQSGLRLAIKGRLVAIVLVGVWLVSTRPPERTTDIVITLSGLAALGICHHLVIGSAWDRKWLKYAFLSIDIALLSVAVAVLPPAPAFDLPQIFMFRFDIYPYYYIILGVAAFSFSPGLVLWAGLFCAGGWLGAFAWARSSMTAPLEWSDALASGSSEKFVQVILDANFAATGSRLQEGFMLLVVAILIAIVVYRARQTVRRQLAAERDKAAVSQIFGRFVPEAVASSIIKTGGTLDPIERQATVLFLDIAGFTTLTESKGAQGTIDILNAYFDAATGIISKHHGVVTQFQGDAILAVFNVPVENEAYAQCAYDAAIEILAKISDSIFAGERLAVRAGLHSGPLVAGNVGGGGRQSYTVHGDTVNLAARLEALNKVYDTSLLVSQSTVDLLDQVNLEKVGQAEIRGMKEPVTIYTPSRT